MANEEEPVSAECSVFIVCGPRELMPHVEDEYTRHLITSARFEITLFQIEPLRARMERYVKRRFGIIGAELRHS